MAAATVASTPHQTLPLRFADTFWDPSNRGVDVIVQKLQNSKQTCEEVKKLYEIRSQIEEDYGDRLLKLSQLIVGQTEEGTLSESLSHIPSALETTARAHMDLAQQLKYHLEEPLDEFLQEQRDRRKQYQQQIEKALQLKNMHYTNATKAKEFYTAECTKVAGMEKYLRLCGPEMTAEELDQTREEIDEGKKMMLAAEQEFKGAINTYNSVTNDWIEIWRASCDTFQDMETQRIDYVHASLRSFATMMSSVCLVDDQCCERIRTTVDMTNSQRDIEEFITRYGTGGDVPELMKFEAFMGMDLRASPTPTSSDKQEPEPKQKEVPEEPKQEEVPEEPKQEEVPEEPKQKEVPEEPKQKEVPEEPKQEEVPEEPKQEEVPDDDRTPQSVEETAKDNIDAVEALDIGEAPNAEALNTEAASLEPLELPAKPESVKEPESETESDNESDSDDDDDEVEVLESMTFHKIVEDPRQKDEASELAKKAATPAPVTTITTPSPSPSPSSEVIYTQKEDTVISAIQEVEDYLCSEQTSGDSAKKGIPHDEQASASPEEPSAPPPTPPLPIQETSILPEKDKPASPSTTTTVALIPSEVAHKEPLTDHDEHAIANTKAAFAATAAAIPAVTVSNSVDRDADSGSTDSINVIQAIVTTSNTEPAPLQPIIVQTSPRVAIQTQENSEPVVVVVHPVSEMPQKEEPAPEPLPKDLPSTPVVVSTASSISSANQAAHDASPRSSSPRSASRVVSVQFSDSLPNHNLTDDESEGDNESEKGYRPPPPKAEEWVISSIRRPQQLPVRVQGARMSMSVMSTPSLPTALDPDHFRQPSASTGHKFSRPNAPFKIEIPNKIASTSAVHGNITNPTAGAATHDQQEPVYTAPQTAAQQVIAAGRAHAHQTSSWQSPVTTTPNRRFSSVDPKRYQDYHRHFEPMAEQNTLYEVDDELPGRKSLDSRLDSNASSNSNSNSTQTKKSHHLSSFVKGVLKPENLGSKQQSGSTLAVEKPAKEKSKDKRFSMNIFGGKKDKHRNKQQQQQEQLYEPIMPIFEDTEMYNGSRSTPLLRPSSAAIPVRSFVQSQQHHSHHNLYQHAQQQQQQHVPKAQDRLEDGTPVVEYVRAIWTYEAKISSELSFMSGDGLAVISKQIDGWWLAELMDPQRRRRGLVPGNYMESVMA